MGGEGGEAPKKEGGTGTSQGDLAERRRRGGATARRRTTAEEERGRRRHEQVSSGGDGGERRERGDGQEESDNASKGWSGESAEDSAGLERKEEAMTTRGGRGGKGDTDVDAIGHAGYWRRSDTCVSVGRRGQHW